MKSDVSNSEDMMGVAPKGIDFRPLAIGQFVLGVDDGQAWRVVYRETVRRKTLQIILASGTMNVLSEVSYVYECECEATDDGRLVFHDQLGTAFIVLDHAESLP